MKDLERLKKYFVWNDLVRDKINGKLTMYKVSDIKDVKITKDATFISFESERFDDLTLNVYSYEMFMSYHDGEKYVIDDVLTLNDLRTKQVSYSHHLAINAYQKMKSYHGITIYTNKNTAKKNFRAL